MLGHKSQYRPNAESTSCGPTFIKYFAYFIFFLSRGKIFCRYDEQSHPYGLMVEVISRVFVGMAGINSIE